VTAVADTGYSNGEHGALCEQDGITAVVPRAETVNPNGPNTSAVTGSATIVKRQLALSGRGHAEPV